MLTGLKLLAENLRSTHLLPANEQRTYASLKGLVVKIIQETRHVSNNLMPPVLSDFGLEPALRYVAEQAVHQSGLTIRVLSLRADTRLKQSMEGPGSGRGTAAPLPRFTRRYRANANGP